VPRARETRRATTGGGRPNDDPFADSAFQALNTGSIPVARLQSRSANPRFSGQGIRGEGNRDGNERGPPAGAFGWGPKGRWFKSSRPDSPVHPHSSEWARKRRR
jgi:hypothetical protein